MQEDPRLAAAPPSQAQPTLARRLGLVSAVMITVGAVIGSGIFLKPLDISQSLPGTAWIFGAWIGLGLVCLFGAFAYAELGAMYPEAGGQYAFLRESFGRFPAFLYGWTFLLALNTGTIAGLSVAFASSLAELVPLADTGQFLVAVGMIVLLAGVNHFGVNWGAVLQDASTFAKLAALAAIVVAGFVLVTAGGGPAEPAASAGGDALQKSFVTGLVAIFWAYEGWYQLPFNAAELKRPERDLPRGLIWGVLILIATYVAVNAVYLHVVPLAEMRTFTADVQVPRTAVERIFGGEAGSILAFLICLSVFGAANPNLLSSPRAFYAMAQDGLLWRRMMFVHPVHRTPTVAIWFQAAWAVVLVWVLKAFRDITEFVVFAALLFYALTVAGVYVLRARRPDAPRPYRCWGYPLTPALFVLVVLWVDVRVLIEPENQVNALYGLLIIGSGVPIYLWMTWRARRAGARGSTDA